MKKERKRERQRERERVCVCVKNHAKNHDISIGELILDD